IIAALVHDPRLLIIDEPMVGLDALAQRQVKVLLRRLTDEGKTVFLTTHTLSVAEAVCDRIAILHRGKIIATGVTSELKEAAGRLTRREGHRYRDRKRLHCDLGRARAFRPACDRRGRVCRRTRTRSDQSRATRIARLARGVGRSGIDSR